MEPSAAPGTAPEAAAGQVLPDDDQDRAQPQGTSLQDLPDHLLGLVFGRLVWNGRARKALYSSCRAFRESPAINLQLKTTIIQHLVQHNEQDVLPVLQNWPRFAAPVKNLVINSGFRTPSVLQALHELPPWTRCSLQSLETFEVRSCGLSQPWGCMKNPRHYCTALLRLLARTHEHMDMPP